MVFHLLHASELVSQVQSTIDQLASSTVRDHICRRLDDCVVMKYPFPHLIIQNFLPEGLYRQVILKWPSHEVFNQQKNDRQFLWINHGCLKRSSLPFETRLFWQTFGEVVINRFTKPRVIEKFLPYKGVKFQTNDTQKIEEISQKIEFWDNRQDGLVMYPAKNSLAPHIDESNVFAQILLYCPRDDDHRELGTVLHSGSPVRSLKAKERHNNDLKVAKTIPYTPNTLVVFLHSPLSWHSVKGYQYQDNYMRQLFVGSISLSPESLEQIYGDQIPFTAKDLYLHEHLLLNIDEID